MENDIKKIYDVILDLFRYGDREKYVIGLWGDIFIAASMFLYYVGYGLVELFGSLYYGFIWILWLKFLMKVGKMLALDKDGEVGNWIYILYGMCVYLTGVCWVGMVIYLIVSL
jgi:hypothetical protein